MREWYSSGIITYYSNWLVINCDYEICRYYRDWIRRVHNIKVHPPLHGAHITIVAGKYEDASKHPNWGNKHGKKILFKYSTEIYKNDEYFWLKVYSKGFTLLRQDLGLGEMPIPFHLTIGNIKNA